MKRIMAIMAVLSLLMMSGVMGAATITAPADGAELAIGSTYEFGGTSGLTGATYNCTFRARHKGKDSWTTLGTTLGDAAKVNATIPNSFGLHEIQIGCINATTATRYTIGGNSTAADTTTSITFKQYSTAEASEVTIDLIVAVGAVLVGFASLIGLMLLYGWVKKKV